MRRFALLLLALAACAKTDPLFCQQNPGASGCTDGGNGGSDGHGNVDARFDFGAGAYAVHLTGPAAGPLDLTATTMLDTAGAMCSGTQLWTDSRQPGACFIVGTTITLGVSGTIAVSGPRPLVLVATDKMVVTGIIDGAGHVGGSGGPGAPDGACGTPTAAGNNMTGGGGGAGGTFVTQGGNGGSANGGTTAGGQAVMLGDSAPTILRAGCSGEIGGTGGTGGPAGEAGGALYLVAGNEIDMRTGRIDVSGGGGNPSTNRGGGGGGGSGGMLVLYAPSILVDNNTRIVANGGGGASGGNPSLAGTDPNITTPLTAAPGGSGGTACGNLNVGGSGSTGTGAGGGGGSTGAGCGGGGGGGGAGYIQTNVTLQSGVFSPAPVVQ